MSRDALLEYVRDLQSGGIQVTFSGKDVAQRIARKVQPRSLKWLSSFSVGSEEEQAKNTLLEGENLQSMVTLYKERGQVDLILTDPPYNTGKDFRYNDRWDEDPNDPGLGDLVAEDDGKRHTKWLRFMYPRLQVMKAMLKSTGVIAICIDHRELFRLGQLLDEVFGEANRLAIINWQKSYAPRNDNKHVSTATEYVLVYARDMTRVKTGLLDRTEGMDAKYTNPDDDPEGLWRPDNACAGEGSTHPGMVYGIQNPFTGEVMYPPDGKCWRSERPRMRRWLEEWGGLYEDRVLDDGKPSPALVLTGVPLPTPIKHPLLVSARAHAETVRDTKVWPQLWFGKRGAGRPNLKRYHRKVKKGLVPMTYWAGDDYDDPEILGSTSWEHSQSGHSQTGINELDAIVGKGHGFETVKPLKLFSKIVQLWCPPTGVVLDPFAGSGTTGQAVLQLNHATGSDRRFILIEQGRPARGDPYARSLTADRLKRVISGSWASGKRAGLGGGYRFGLLQAKVDAKALLSMERDEMVDVVIASHFDTTRRGGPGLVLMTRDGHRYLVARNAEEEGFFLVWHGGKEPPTFTEDVYDRVVLEARDAGLKPNYHVYARFNHFQSDDVRFYQIPDRILMDFGLTVNEPFNND